MASHDINALIQIESMIQRLRRALHKQGFFGANSHDSERIFMGIEAFLQTLIKGEEVKERDVKHLIGLDNHLDDFIAAIESQETKDMYQFWKFFRDDEELLGLLSLSKRSLIELQNDTLQVNMLSRQGLSVVIPVSKLKMALKSLQDVFHQLEQILIGNVSYLKEDITELKNKLKHQQEQGRFFREAINKAKEKLEK